MDENAFDNTGLRYKVLGQCVDKLSEGFTVFSQQLAEARRMLDALMQTPYYRRRAAEAERGRRIPDWEWRVMEKKRRTFGSGNGRIMRD